MSLSLPTSRACVAVGPVFYTPGLRSQLLVILLLCLLSLSFCGSRLRLGNGLQNVMAIYNAVLTGRRVVFVGYNHAAGDVCKIVLAACALVSPPIQVGGVGRGRGREIF